MTDVERNFEEGFTQINHYDSGGGIWVPNEDVLRYSEYADPGPSEVVLLEFPVEASTDFKHQILPGDNAYSST